MERTAVATEDRVNFYSKFLEQLARNFYPGVTASPSNSFSTLQLMNFSVPVLKTFFWTPSTPGLKIR